MSMTPYQQHETLGHSMTRYSPNGIDLVEECSECGMRFLFTADHAPTAMRPLSSATLQTQHELAMAYDAKLREAIAKGRKG